MSLIRPSNRIFIYLANCIAVTAFLAMPKLSFATTPPTSSTDRVWVIDEPFVSPGQLAAHPRRDFQDIIGQFRQTCLFLNGMQEHDREIDNFGGLHEGEGDALWAIVESDNTQEAIRVWCEYGLYFNDAERFHQNIEDAWTYLQTFPAWRESAPGEMYGIHNSGWGLIAEMAYRRLYNDSQSEYGRQCAELIMNSTPQIAVDNADALMPLVAGFGAGTLYRYGEVENNQDYKAAALRIGNQVKNWIDRDPNRLHGNEVWALCGGTALWGVVNSLGRNDSAAIADWVIEVSGQMDVFAGRGQWNNSWNIWYSHAWLDAYHLTGREQFLQNSQTIVDSLVSQDGDDDGGIPATIGDSNDRDQAWVSAYTAWMGLRARFELLPQVDGTVISLVSPSISSPLPVGRPVTMSFIVQQRGLTLPVEMPLHLSGGWQFDTTLTLTQWEPQEVTLSSSWTPDRAGETHFAAYFAANAEADRSDDTLNFSLNIVPVGDLQISFRNVDQSPVGGRIVLTNLEWGELVPPETLMVDGATGNLAANLIAGYYRVDVRPDFPYAIQSIDSLNIVSNGSTPLALTFSQPSVLLVDADTISVRAKYFENALTDAGAQYHMWNRNDRGSITNRSHGFRTVVYFTGNRTTETIPADDITELTQFAADGGSLFITGQNVSDDLEGTQFLGDVLHARHLTDYARSQHIDGVEGDPIFNGKRLLILGGQGANNQTSPAGIAPVNGAVAMAFYTNRGDTAAAIRWESQNGGRGVFFAFGFEGISGQGGTGNRPDLMRSVLTWLNTPLSVPPATNPELIQSPAIASLWPNPFNDQVVLNVDWGKYTAGRVLIFDQLGRSVRELSRVGAGSYRWDGNGATGLKSPAGIYFVRLEGVNGASAVTKLVYLR